MKREEQGDLFGRSPAALPSVPRWPLRDDLKARMQELAKDGVYFGTSSWKYEGWLGQLYSPERYRNSRGQHSKARFEDACLSEYAEVFKAVGVDATYYAFPREENLCALSDQVPDDFQFGFKVTEFITVKHFPNVAKSGAKAGQRNPDFLNGELFASAFLKPCEVLGAKVGVLMFEFSRFAPYEYDNVSAFLPDLDTFLSSLPAGWPYAIELRNRHWLTPEYFSCLSRHRVTHVFNSWDAMPSVIEQMAMPGSMTNSELVAARFLLKPGRKYQTAVDAFKPYDRIQEVNDDGRRAGKTLVRERRAKKKKTLIFVNNRFEGNVPMTIAEMMPEQIESEFGKGGGFVADKKSRL